MSEQLTAHGFVRAMQRRFKERAALDDDQSLYHAVVALESTEDAIGPFGCPEGEWTEAAAFEVVDDELSYWETA